MSRRKHKYEWCVFDTKTQELCCERCGEREKPKLPMSITAFVALTKYFNEKHKYCKTPKEAVDHD